MKNKFFLLATLTIIANTHVKGMQFDPEFNAFVDPVNRELTQQEKTASSKLTAAATETFQSAWAWFEQQLGIQSTVEAIVTDNPIAPVSSVIEPVEPTAPMAQPAITEPAIEKINRIEQLKETCLKPFAIVSFVCCVGLIAYKTYQYTHDTSETDKNVAEHNPVTEVN